MNTTVTQLLQGTANNKLLLEFHATQTKYYKIEHEQRRRHRCVRQMSEMRIVRAVESIFSRKIHSLRLGANSVILNKNVWTKENTVYY